MQFFSKSLLAALSLSTAVIASPTPVQKRDAGDIVSSVTGVVATLTADVKTPLAGIAAHVTAGVTTSLVPDIEADLKDLQISLSGAVSDLVPIVTGVVGDILDGQLSDLTVQLNTVEGLVSNVTSTLEHVVNTAASGKSFASAL